MALREVETFILERQRRQGRAAQAFPPGRAERIPPFSFKPAAFDQNRRFARDLAGFCSPKTVLGHPKGALGDSKTALGDPKGVLGDSKMVLEVPEGALGVSKTVLGVAERLLGVTKAASGVTGAVLGFTGGALVISKVPLVVAAGALRVAARSGGVGSR